MQTQTGENRLSVRSYINRYRCHYHPWYQMVLPLHGAIQIRVGDYDGPVGVGQAVIILAQQNHEFRASETARFVVADLLSLPSSLQNLPSPVITLSTAFFRYLQYVETQLKQSAEYEVQQTMFALFVSLLEHETGTRRLDPRIQRVLNALHGEPATAYSIDQLAGLANVSPGHLKKLFSKATGESVMGYLTRIRMEKAQALLANTDTPVALVANACGYLDASAFCRRFRRYFGHSPRQR